ncbi:hypothetical protein M3201_16485 [Paenibacillus motobuensis]|uniref:putative ABC transporter permease subunit n=1 Tax=Paenibacillus TaxID=44249 RepID=UPI00203CC7C4|nr:MULTISPECIES: hypothetical protein [Paenibacillus]MCM3041304.1 hypothetical protein [Paenibacillus lutimineralis]MCM3648408.1 hypothetical protein [Paenibacillus motobuensis]
MINIWRLTKIQLLSTFGLNKALHTRDGKERRKFLLLSIGILIGVVIIAGYSFVYSYLMAQTFEQIGRMELLLAIMMAATSILGFFTTIYKASGVLYNYKDYDLVMSLPIRTSYVVASRVLQLYVLNLFVTLILMLPAGAVYAIKVNPEVVYYLSFLITLLFIPLLPIIAAALIGALISWVSSRFRASRVITIVLTMAVTIGIMVGSFSLKGNEQMLTDMGTQLADMIFKLYPLASMYVDAVCSYQIGPLVLFIAISLLAFILFSIVLGTRYKAIHTGLTTSHTSSKYVMRSLKTSSPFRALYIKELRRYFSSSLYVLNTSIMMILLLVASIALLFVSSENLGQLIKIPQLSDYLGSMAPMVVSLIVACSCTTSSSISLEGNHLWILKSSPVSKKDILLSKVAVNLTITIPISVIICLLLMISVGTGWIESLLLLVIPIIYACYSAMLGVIVNLKFPKLDWTSEVTAIKQSASVLVSMLLGFISVVIPVAILFLLSHVNGNLILLGIGVMMLAVCGMMYKYIATQGERLFQAL